jgi:ankyrin repeat protein
MDSLVDSVISGPSGVKRALQELKPDIGEACGKTIERMKKQLSKTRWIAVKNLLAWIVLSRRLFTVTELGHAMVVAGLPTSQAIDKDSIPPIRSIASWCGGLVNIDNNGLIYLIHPTIRRYFLDRIEELFGDWHKTIAMACLSYLSLDEVKTPCEGPNRMALLRLRNQRYPFLSYAAQYWGYHMRQSGADAMKYQALALLESEKTKTALIQVLCYIDETWVIEKKASALHLVAHFGLISLASTLIEAGENVNTLDETGATPIMYAVAHGHVDMVDNLLAWAHCLMSSATLVPQH